MVPFNTLENWYNKFLKKYDFDPNFVYKTTEWREQKNYVWLINFININFIKKYFIQDYSSTSNGIKSCIPKIQINIL